MLGMKGGGAQTMPQGQNPNLAGLFQKNMATAPAQQQQQIPQIMAPQRPQMMAPAATSPMQRTATPQPMSPHQMIAIGGGLKPAWMTSLVQQTGRPTTPTKDRSAYTTFRNR